MNASKKPMTFGAVALWAASSCLDPAGATTITPYDFSDVVGKAAVVIEGTVVDLQVVSNGKGLVSEPRLKSHRAPAAALPEPDREEAPATAQAEPSTAAPEAVGVEGGRMLFTEVTLAVARDIVGEAGPTVTLRIAGGKDGTEEVQVFGMPRFELGHRYLVFLRQGYAETGVPIVGVNQGFFEITTTAEGEEQLLDSEGDVVVAIEKDRVVCRHNPERTDARTPRLGPAPVPEQGSGVRAALSPEVVRYWLTEEPPLPVEDFVAAIKNVKEK